MIDPTGTAMTVIQLAYQVYQQAELAKNNKKKCRRLASSARTIAAVLQALEKKQHQVELSEGAQQIFNGALINLDKTLQKAMGILNKQQNMSFPLTFLFARGYKQDLDDINTSLHEDINILNLALNTQTYVDRNSLVETKSNKSVYTKQYKNAYTNLLFKPNGAMHFAKPTQKLMDYAAKNMTLGAV